MGEKGGGEASRSRPFKESDKHRRTNKTRNEASPPPLLEDSIRYSPLFDRSRSSLTSRLEIKSRKRKRDDYLLDCSASRSTREVELILEGKHDDEDRYTRSRGFERR